MGAASMGRGGFSSRGSVGFHGGASFGSAARLGSAPRFGAAFGTGLRQPLRNRGSFGGFRQPVFGFRRFHHRVFLGSVVPRYYGYYGYPTYYGYSSYYGDAFYSTPDYYPGYDYYGSSYSASANSAQNDIAQQQQDIDRLEDEVARLQEQRETEQTETAQAEAGGVSDAQKESRSEPTLLVFRDKHTQEVENYAIVGGTLWIFSEQRATKLPLSWLDIEATTKANDDRGVNFRVPQ
jgi:hypothetical protein